MAREDFTKAQRDAWQAERLAGERARGVHSRGINQLPRYDKRTMDPFGPKGSLAKAINQPISAAVKAKANEAERGIARKAARDGRIIDSTVPSSCLADLYWESDGDPDNPEAGTATATFYRGGTLTYDYPMSLSDYLEWVQGENGSIGEYGNTFVFD